MYYHSLIKKAYDFLFTYHPSKLDQMVKNDLVCKLVRLSVIIGFLIFCYAPFYFWLDDLFVLEFPFFTGMIMIFALWMIVFYIHEKNKEMYNKFQVVKERDV